MPRHRAGRETAVTAAVAPLVVSEGASSTPVCEVRAWAVSSLPDARMSSRRMSSVATTESRRRRSLRLPVTTVTISTPALVNSTNVTFGNTITLSNFGMIAGKYAAPIVVPPTVAILGAGRIHEQVVAAGGAPAVHRVLPLSLTFDHRVVTGGEAARFLAAVIADLEATA